MEKVHKYEVNKKSSYIKRVNEKKSIYILSFIFLVVYYFMPQYFGISVAGFDLTAQRFMMLVMILYIISYTKVINEFIALVRESIYLPYIFAFMCVTLYTMVFRVDINTFMQSAIEFICLFLLVYIIKNVLGIEKTLQIIKVLLLIMCLQGIIEYVLQFSLFQILETLPGKINIQIRSGSYRIMGPCNHALAYGLVLILSFPLVCVDIQKRTLNLLQNKFLFIILTINIFLTGSRSALAIFIVESIVIIILSDKRNKKKTIVFLFWFFSIGIFVILALYNTSLSQTILRQFASIIDEIFGTQWAVKFGAEITRLNQSSSYRSLLPKVFIQKWLNPLIGRGVSKHFSAIIDGYTIMSIDNFFVAQYIRYAYPGLIIYVLFLINTLIKMLRNVKINKGLVLACLIGFVSYYVNLWFMDALQTLKYAYLIMAIFQVVLIENNVNENNVNESVIKEKKSKYIK